ncbi:hypothetical protein K8O92_15330 [Nocardia asteroides]|nr:hypothetical protein K8O92_15330 [Nocardia asteroides]
MTPDELSSETAKVSAVKLLGRPAVVALVYIVSSILIGPAIYLTGYGLVQSSDRCGGSALVIPDHPSGGLPQIDTTAPREVPAAGSQAREGNADYFAAKIFWVAGAGIMLAVGVLLLVLLVTNRSRTGRFRLVLSSLGVLIMVFGYGVTLAAGLHPNSCT